MAKQKKGQRKKGLSKSQKDMVKSIIDTKLDDAVEDKFSRMSLYHSIEQQWDAQYHQTLSIITPQIYRGDNVNQRTGLRVHPKFMRVELRYIPHGYDSAIVDSESGNPILTGQVPTKTPLDIFIFRMARRTYTTLQSGDIMAAVNTRYRAPGLWKQDTLESVNQELLKALQLLHRQSLPSKYFSQMVRLRDDPVNFHSRCRVINCPIQSNARIQFKIPNKFMLYENSTDLDANYVYFMVCRQLDVRTDTTYTGVAAPLKLEYRTVFVYEDA